MKRSKEDCRERNPKKKSERCLDGGINASLKGWSAGGTAPYGYQRVAVNKFTGERRVLGAITVQDGTPLLNEKGLPMYEQRKPKEVHVVWELGDPQEVKTVKQVFDWTVNNSLGITKIAKMLNSLNVECPRRGRWRNIDSKWSASTVADMIKNRSYTGARVYNRLKRHGIGKYAPRNKEQKQSEWIIVENAHPPIVSNEIWTAANSTEHRKRYQSMNRFTTESPYLLSGLIRCSHCNFNFTGRSMLFGRPWNRKKEYVYVDSGYERKGPSVCASKTINKKSLETFILNLIRERFLNANFQDKIQKAIDKKLKSINPDLPEKRKEFQKRLKECERKLTSLLVLVEKGVQVDTIIDRIKSLEEEKRQILQSIKELQSENAKKNEIQDIVVASRKFIHTFLDRFDDMSLEKKKEGMKQIVAQIIVDREKDVARCFLRVVPLLKQHPFIRNISRNELVEKSQLSSSLDYVPPTRFELVFQA